MKANSPHKAALNRLALLGSYALPWIFTYAILRIWIGYAPWFAGDTVAGMLGHGLSWVSLFPNFTNHVPMPTSTQLAALIYGLSQPQINGLKYFHDMSLLVELGLLLLLSCWFGYAAHRLEIPKRAALVLGLISATMPTMMLGATAFTGYVPFLIFLPPAILVYVFQINQKNPFQTQYWISLALIGFCVANLFTLSLLAILAPMLCVFLHRSDFLLKINRLQFSKKYTFICYASLLAALQSLALGIMFFSDPVHNFGRGIVRKLVSYGMPFLPDLITIFILSSVSAVILLGVIGIVVKARPIIHKLFIVSIAPLLVGWLVASNIWSPFWMISAIYSLKSKGGTGGASQSAQEGLVALGNLHLIHPWIWTISISFGVTLTLWIWSRTQKNIEMRNFSLSLVGIFILHFVLMMPLLIGMIRETDNISYITLTMRYFVPFIGGLACCMAVFTRYKMKIGLSIGLCLAISSIYIYGTHAHRFAQQYSTHDKALESAINTFLTQSQQEEVVCLRTGIPADCNLLYGFNNYRTINSIKRFPPIQLKNGRIVYLNDCWNNTKDACISYFDQYFREKNKVLVIGLKEQIRVIENETSFDLTCLLKAPSVSFDSINAYLCKKAM